MNTPKYYTPKIEEFHVGFEYESNYLSDDWEKKILSIQEADYFFSSYYNDAVEIEFRVKHLDRSDIESFGFKQSGPITVETIIFQLGDFELALQNNPSIGVVEIWNLGIEYSDGEIIFKGRIKNKSELKKILRMVGVIE